VKSEELRVKTRILFAGMGGVGGYFGGVMAHHFQGQNEIEIAFLARGEHLKTIREKGLTVRKGAVEFQAHPACLSFENLYGFDVKAHSENHLHFGIPSCHRELLSIH
jgi:hypothetical protein